MKQYEYALIYNDSKEFDKWLKEYSESSISFKIPTNFKGNHYIFTVNDWRDLSVDNAICQERWYIHKYSQEQDLIFQAFNSRQLYMFKILDGMIRGDHVMYLMSRLRGGVSEIK